MGNDFGKQEKIPSRFSRKNYQQAVQENSHDMSNLQDIFEENIIPQRVKNPSSRASQFSKDRVPQKKLGLVNSNAGNSSKKSQDSRRLYRAQNPQLHTSQNTSLFIPMPQNNNSEHPSASYSGLLQRSYLINAMSTAIQKKFNSQILITDLQTPLLKEVFKRNLVGIKKEVESIQAGLTKKFQHYEITVAFWMAIHLEFEEICNFLLHKEKMLCKLVVAIQKKDQDQKMGIYSRKNSRKTYKSQKSGLDEANEMIYYQARLNGIAVSTLQGSIKNLKSIKEEKNDEEQKKLDYSSLDQLLPSEMHVSTEMALTFAITEEVLINAIEKDQFDFIFYLYVFGKNFMYDKKTSKSTQITFKMLFSVIKAHKSDIDEFKEIAKDICDWKLQLAVDNFLEALLQFQLDDLVIEYMGFYLNDLNERLLIFCVEAQNKKFLKIALQIRAFDKMVFREDSFVKLALLQLNDGTKTNYILNILSLIDISIWKNRQFKEILEIFNDFSIESYDKNKLLLSYNPILTISLSCEVLRNIAECRKKFQNECSRISNQFLMLGQMYLSKIQDEKFYEKLILDQDIKDRSILKIITENSFEKLMDQNDPKAENLMNKLWSGQEVTNCDGDIYGYSSLTYLLMKPYKKINSSFSQLGLLKAASNSFEPNFRVDYSFQHRYRSRSISFYFMKEFICAIVMLVTFQLITQRYLNISSLIIAPYYENRDQVIQAHLRFLDDNSTATDSTDLPIPEIDATQLNNPLKIIGYIFCFSLIFQWLLKVIFNLLSKHKFVLDMWTHLDTIYACLNILSIQMLSNSSTHNIIKPLIKDSMDYVMITVLLVCWLRFLLYFLVIRKISNMLLTLMVMIMDTVAFLFIVSCFIIIMASIFTTLFQDVNPDYYGSLTITIRTLFYAMLATYDYSDMGGRLKSYTLVMDFFVFASNVLLLNFLISILSTTYEKMVSTSVFKYKQNVYRYCERYLQAFKEEAYGEIVLHPPPISCLCIVLLPFMFNKEKLLQVVQKFSITMYWMENFIFLAGFVIFEVIIIPFSYLKNVYNMLFKTNNGPFKGIFVTFAWLVIGFPICFCLVFKDTRNLFKLLQKINGCKAAKNSLRSLIQAAEPSYLPSEGKEEKLTIEQQTQILNEARDSVILLYLALKKHFNNGKKTISSKKRSNRSQPVQFNIPTLQFNVQGTQSRKGEDQRQSLLSVPEKSVRSNHNLKNSQKGLGTPIDNISPTQRNNQTKQTYQNSEENNYDDSSSVDFSDDSDTDVKNFDINTELELLKKQTGYNTNNSDCLYVVKKNLIVEDWTLRHKIYLHEKSNKLKNNNGNGNDGKDNDKQGDSLFAKKRSIRSQSLQVPQKKGIVNELSPASMLMEARQKPAASKINQKIGQKVKADIIEARRKTGVVILDDLLNAGKQKQQKLQQQMVEIKNFEKSKTQVQNKDVSEVFSMQISQIEIDCVYQFFSNFVIVSEQSLEEQHIDIVLFLRALPHRITEENLYQVQMFNFKICQESLIAYQNLDLVNAFQYFDDKNRERVSQVKEKLISQKKSIHDVLSNTRFVIKRLDHQLYKKKHRRSKSNKATSSNSRHSSSANNYNSNKDLYKLGVAAGGEQAARANEKIPYMNNKGAGGGVALLSSEQEKESLISMNMQSPADLARSRGLGPKMRMNYIF